MDWQMGWCHAAFGRSDWTPSLKIPQIYWPRIKNIPHLRCSVSHSCQCQYQIYPRSKQQTVLAFLYLQAKMFVITPFICPVNIPLSGLIPTFFSFKFLIEKPIAIEEFGCLLSHICGFNFGIVRTSFLEISSQNGHTSLIGKGQRPCTLRIQFCEMGVKQRIVECPAEMNVHFWTLL